MDNLHTRDTSVPAPQVRDNEDKGRRTFREDHCQFKHAVLPRCLDTPPRVSVIHPVHGGKGVTYALFSGDTDLPLHQIHRPIR